MTGRNEMQLIRIAHYPGTNQYYKVPTDSSGIKKPQNP